jgi:hypothetical protein
LKVTIRALLEKEVRACKESTLNLIEFHDYSVEILWPPGHMPMFKVGGQKIRAPSYLIPCVNVCCYGPPSM